MGELAEGEELGSNLLHVGQGTPASSGGRGSWERRGQRLWRPPSPPVDGLHNPFSDDLSTSRTTCVACGWSASGSVGGTIASGFLGLRPLGTAAVRTRWRACVVARLLTITGGTVWCWVADNPMRRTRRITPSLSQGRGGHCYPNRGADDRSQLHGRRLRCLPKVTSNKNPRSTAARIHCQISVRATPPRFRQRAGDATKLHLFYPPRGDTICLWPTITFMKSIRKSSSG